MAAAPPVSAAPRISVAFVLLALLGAAASAALLLWVVRDPVFTGAFLAGLIGLGGLLLAAGRFRVAPAAEAPPRTDLALLRSALDSAGGAVAITDLDGAMVCANGSYSEWFGGGRPVDLPSEGEEDLAAVAAEARRDGTAKRPLVRIHGLDVGVALERTGYADTHLVWRFTRSDDVDLLREAQRLIGGAGGKRLSEAGVMAALVDADGNLLSANLAFVARATGRPDAAVSGTPLVSLIAVTEEGQFHFAREPRGTAPLRIIQIPITEGADPLTLFLLLDDPSGGRGRLGKEESASINALLDFLPLGLALANVDGRFIYLNKAFRKAVGLPKEGRPVYPGDLVVDEDKAAVSDAVRRFARGPSTSSDMAVRLKAAPDEPVALGIAGARGLGEAAVILSLKDNSEADRLKRQVAQATEDAGGGAACRRRRSRFQQHPHRHPRLLRPHADAPHARRQRL
jgi:two-component system cell cycle sensor histidine kinase/response regulator CckA